MTLSDIAFVSKHQKKLSFSSFHVGNGKDRMEGIGSSLALLVMVLGWQLHIPIKSHYI